MIVLPRPGHAFSSRVNSAPRIAGTVLGRINHNRPQLPRTASNSTRFLVCEPRPWLLVEERAVELSCLAKHSFEGVFRTDACAG